MFIYRNKGETPPTDYLEAACKAYPSWSGLGIIANGEITLSKDHEGPANPLGIISICNGEFKDHDILFCLGQEEGNVKLTEDHANLQPFDLVEIGEGDNAVTKVAVFVDGPLEIMATNNAPEGRPYLFTGQHIAPFIHNIWNLCNADVDKFMEQMRMPHVEAMFLSTAGPDSAIAIMTTASDKPFAYYNGTSRGDEYSWGFVNDTCGWTAKAAETSTTATAANKNKTTLKMGTASAEPVRDTTSEVVWNFRVQPNIIKNADIRDVYILYHGKVPPKYQERPLASLLPGVYEKASKDQRISLSPLVASTTPVGDTTKTPTQTAQQIQDAVTKDNLKKFVDSHVLQVMSPEDMAKNELPLPTFWDQTGWKSEDFINSKNRGEIMGKMLKGAAFETSATELVRDLCYIIFQLNKELELATAPTNVGDEGKSSTIAVSAPSSKGRFKMSA